MRHLVLAAFVLMGCQSKTPAPATPVVVAPPVQEVVPVKVADSLEVTLLAVSKAFIAGQPVELRMKVRNPTTKPLRFCTYHTLFEGLRNDVLDVTGPSGEVEYRGMMAKRAPPGPEDFLSLAPGAEVESRTVDVSEGYAFTAGKFSVVFPGGSISELAASAPLVLQVEPSP